MYDIESIKNAVYEHLYMNAGIETETITQHIFEAIRNMVAAQGLYAPPLSEYDGYFMYQGVLTSPELDVTVIDNSSIEIKNIYTRGFFMIAQARSSWSFTLAKDAVLYIIPFAPVKIKHTVNGGTPNLLTPDGRVYKVSGAAAEQWKFEFFASEPFVFVWNPYSTTPAVTVTIKSEVNFTPIYPIPTSIISEGDYTVYSYDVEYIDLPIIGVI